MTILANPNLNANISAGTGAFTSITAFLANTLTPTGFYDHVRISIRPATAGVNLLINALWMGSQGGANAFSFNGDQVQLKLAGSGSFTITTSGADFALDIVKFKVDTTKQLLFAYDGASNASARDLRRNATGGNNTVYFGGGVQGSDAATQAKSGYSSQVSTCDMILEIEGFSYKKSKISSRILG